MILFSMPQFVVITYIEVNMHTWFYELDLKTFRDSVDFSVQFKGVKPFIVESLLSPNNFPALFLAEKRTTSKIATSTSQCDYLQQVLRWCHPDL
jgi:hypothetical protein